MATRREKVVVAMSGGVDSSVAACLLVEQGYDVMGLFMRVGVDEPAPSCDRPTGKSVPQAESVLQAKSVPRPNEDQFERAAGFSPRGSTEVYDQDMGAERAAGPVPRGSSNTTASSSIIVGPRKPNHTVRSHQGCCSATDAADARFVAGMLGIPFHALDFQSDFDWIIDYFVDEYVRGRTPNPCVVCNKRLKFGRLVDYADAVGAKCIATGHYARIGKHSGRNVLMRGCDPQKDQSYVLFSLNRAILDRVMFPVGELTKSEVRRIAARFDLPNRDKPDSVEICFAPDRDYARVVRQRRPDAFVEGDVLDWDGRVIGRHNGIAQYTIGQRRGLGIAAGKPIYVTRLDAAGNTVTMGDGDALLARSLIAGRVNLLVDVPDGPFRADVKIRYLHKAAPATVEKLGGGKVRVVFDDSQRAITPGQAVVFYDGDVVVGGAWIEQAEVDSPSDTP